MAKEEKVIYREELKCDVGSNPGVCKIQALGFFMTW